MTTKRTGAARVAAHKARGKYLCCTISPKAANALVRIKAHCGHGSQRETIEAALLTLAERLPVVDAMREGAP
jgi:hypothetical protein